MTNTTRSLIFRDEDSGKIRFTISTTTPTYRSGTGLCLQITHGSDSFPLAELDGDELEELHQFTHELLAGPATWRLDPVVDAQIICGLIDRLKDGREVECCLIADHPGTEHADIRGYFFTVPPF